MKAKLDEEQVRAAKALRAMGWPLKRVGRLFGVCEATVSLAVRGKNWRRLGGSADIKTTLQFYVDVDDALDEAIGKV